MRSLLSCISQMPRWDADDGRVARTYSFETQLVVPSPLALDPCSTLYSTILQMASLDTERVLQTISMTISWSRRIPNVRSPVNTRSVSYSRAYYVHRIEREKLLALRDYQKKKGKQR